MKNTLKKIIDFVKSKYQGLFNLKRNNSEIVEKLKENNETPEPTPKLRVRPKLTPTPEPTPTITNYRH